MKAKHETPSCKSQRKSLYTETKRFLRLQKANEPKHAFHKAILALITSCFDGLSQIIQKLTHVDRALKLVWHFFKSYEMNTPH